MRNSVEDIESFEFGEHQYLDINSSFDDIESKALVANNVPPQYINECGGETIYSIINEASKSEEMLIKNVKKYRLETRRKDQSQGFLKSVNELFGQKSYGHGPIKSEEPVEVYIVEAEKEDGGKIWISGDDRGVKAVKNKLEP